MEEVWKDIEGFEDFYKISNLGNVYSKRRKRNLKHCLNSEGYYRVALYNNGKRKYMSIHRLIGIHFIDNPENKPCIDHINKVRNDNRIINLKWATYSENNHNRTIRPITKGGYSKYRKRYQYQWCENKVQKNKYFKTLELVKLFEIEHLKRLE